MSSPPGASAAAVGSVPELKNNEFAEKSPWKIFFHLDNGA